MKQVFLFVFALIVLSIGLTWVWLSGANALYGAFMQPAADALNFHLGLPNPGTMRRSRFINLVPFIALMLLTPRLSLRKRVGGLSIGVMILMASHLILNAIAVGLRSQSKLPTSAALVSDAMPFLIWFSIARDFAQEKLLRLRRHRE